MKSVKNKSLIIVTVCLAVALCVAGVGAAFAWYTGNAGDNDGFELDADGYLVVYFDENEYTLDAIKPAVAKKGAVADNVTEFDVLNVGGNIEEAATVGSKTGFLHYINQSDSDSARAEIAISCEAYMVLPDGSKEKLSLEYDLSVKIEIGWVYPDAAGGDGSAGTLSIKPDDWKTPSKTRFGVDGNADVTLTTTFWLRQVDDLCYPLICEAKSIQVTVKAVVIPESEADTE